MAFKVQRVSKAKAPAVLDSFKDPENKTFEQRQQSSKLTKPPLASKPASSSDHDHNQNKNRSTYAYAGVEFRPLHVTEDGAVSTAILEPGQHELAYQEVDKTTDNHEQRRSSSNILLTSGGSGNNRGVVKKPPPKPKPFSKSKEGEEITDGGKKRAPPPTPKPYNASKKGERDETNLPQQTQDAPVADAVYSVVNKSVKSQHVAEKKVEEDEKAPPLPSRPNFEEEERKKSQENLAAEESREIVEKSGKGFGLIKTFKKHMRKVSDDTGAANKSAERADSKDELEPKPPIKPYLVTDIVNQPSSKMFGEPEMYESITDVRNEDRSSPVLSDLPAGWQEVKDDTGGTYYWHVVSGTTQWNKPQKAEDTASSIIPRPNDVDHSKPKPKVELKKVTSFPVHSMGWVELEESQVAPHNMSDTIAECIANLALQRKDLQKTKETWGDGKDLRLLLVSDTLKLVDAQTKATILVQPISKMRVWGAGRSEQTDFAYVARDQTTGKHKCHVFRCHGGISGRTIHNKLHEMCNKILAEKKKALESQQSGSAATQWSDILNTPPKPSVKDQAGFNVKPVTELKKSFSAKYIGKVNVPKPSGIETLHKAVEYASNAVDPAKWQTCLIDITVSSVKCTDCMSQQVIADDRIKFVSFIGVAKEPRLCGYITSSDQSPPFTCHVFHCIPNAASFTRALEEACRLRLQSCLETNPELAQKLATADAEKSVDKEVKAPIGFKGLFGKLANQTKLSLIRKTSSDAGGCESPETERPREQHPPSNETLIKYYGCQAVSLGTGPAAIKEAVQAAQGTTLQISTLTINRDGITLDDTIKSGLARKHVMTEKVSYCALASDRVHFGVIESIGGGKFLCHVFAEYKTHVNAIVDAINRICLL